MKKTSLLALSTFTLFTAATGFAQSVNITAGSSTTGYIPVFNVISSPSSIKNSQIFDNGTSFIGIGATLPLASEYISIQNNQNASTSTRINNNSTGTAACANFISTAGSAGISITAYGSGYTSSGIAQAGAGVVSSAGTINIGSASNYPLNFFTNNIQQMFLNSSGQVILGAGATAPLSGEMISVQKNQNTATSMRLNNTTSGTAASVNYIATGPNSAIAMSAYSSGYTSSGIAQAGAAVISSSGTALNIGAGTLTSPINFWTGGGARVTLNYLGQLGIGTTSPGSMLDITTTATTGSSLLKVKNTGLTGSGHNQTLFEVMDNGQTFIGIQRQNTSAPTDHQNAILQVNGDIVVGTSGTGAHANIWVTEANWADFVFDANYKLMPLNEVENFYKTNHHLPNVPTAKEIKETGNNLAQTDVVLLQKIEENTLYIVELKKQVETQQKLIEELTKKMADKK